MTHWFCLQVQTRQERRVAALLTEQGVMAYCPIETRWIEVRTRFARRQVPRTRALIPGYVFAVLPTDAALDIARSIRLVREIMSNQFGKPIAVELKDLRGIFLMDLFRCFDETWAPPKRKGWLAKFKPEQRVKMARGIAEGWIGTVLKSRAQDKIEVLFDGCSEAWLVGEDNLTHEAPPLDLALEAAA